MVVHLPALLAVGADSATWAVWSVTVGLLGATWSDDRLRRAGPLTRLRGPEHSGGLYRRIRIRSWKRWLPDLGRFAGGRSHRPGRRLDPTVWSNLELDALRAERVHWLMLAALPVTLLWSDGVLAGAMVAYAAAANLPCIAAQRYTRVRLSDRMVRSAEAHRLP